MARTIDIIKGQILAQIQSNSILNPLLNSVSSTAIYKLFATIVATAINEFENTLDLFKINMNVLLLNLKPHTLYWYTQKAKAFQLGYALPHFEENYNNSSLTEAQITAAKIITQAACMKALRQNQRTYLRLKVAKGATSNLAKLDANELTAMKEYFQQIQDAGVDLSIESNNADEMFMQVTIWYNPQLISASGNSLLTGAPIIKNAIEKYITDLPFNGRYVPDQHKEYVFHSVEGLGVINIDNVYFKKYGSNVSVNPPPNGTIPDAGWLKFYNTNDLQITLIANVE